MVSCGNHGDPTLRHVSRCSLPFTALFIYISDLNIEKYSPPNKKKVYLTAYRLSLIHIYRSSTKSTDLEFCIFQKGMQKCS